MTTIKSMFMMMERISNFYGENGLFFFIYLIAVYAIDTFISKKDVAMDEGAKKGRLENSIYPKWKIILVIFVGADCFFDFGIKDNITYIILIAYTVYVLRRLLLILKYKK